MDVVKRARRWRHGRCLYDERSPLVSSFAWNEIAGLMVAILGGAAVGVERQHSGHATGPDARLGGIRTFTLLGALAGVAGTLLRLDQTTASVAFLAGAIAIVVIGYGRASQKDVDATTEIAAMVVLASGVLGGLQRLQLAAGLTTITVLLLAEKRVLHAFVGRLDAPTVTAAARFAVMSVVILPLLPDGPFGPAPGIKPRELWMLVLLFSGMSFAGFVAHRIGGGNGYALTGLLGGLVSSTSVTLSFARLSATRPERAAALAAGAIAASTVLFMRVTLAVAILNPALVPTLVRYIAAPCAAALLALVLLSRSFDGTTDGESSMQNPLELRSAMVMAALFQVVLFAVFYMRAWIGDQGMLATGFVLGLTDVDALTVSMARGAVAGISLDTAARAIALGIVANTLMKAAIVVSVGRGRFRVGTTAALASSAAAGAFSLTFR